MVTWQTAMQAFITICASFSVVCVAVGWVIKIYKGAKKPSDNVKEKFGDIDIKLDNDNKRINGLVENISYIKKTQTQLLQVCLVILEELKKDNDVDGVIQRTEEDMQSFLINNR